MRLKSFLSVLVIFALVNGTTADTFAYDQLASPVAVPGEGERPFTPGPLLDDFNSGTGGVNLWGGVAGTFQSERTEYGNGFCTVSLSTDTFSGTGYSLRLDYNVSDFVEEDRDGDGTPEVYGSFSGYFSQLKELGEFSGVESGDLSTYKSVSFLVKGATGGELFKIEIKNNGANLDRNHAAVYITDYLDGGVTGEWQQVTIPFHNFANINNWTSMKEFVIVFEYSQSTANGSRTTGTIFIDNIEFNTTAVDIVRMDHFGDRLGTCALGGNIGDMWGSGGAAAHDFVSDAGTFHNYPNGLLSRYDVRNGWAGHFIVFSGGNNGWTALPHNFSEYNYVALYVRANTTDTNPRVIKVEFVDYDSKGYVILDSITTSWQRYRIPLISIGTMSGVDKSTLKQMNFVYEGSRIGDYGGRKQGVLFIDEIQFEK